MRAAVANSFSVPQTGRLPIWISLCLVAVAGVAPFSSGVHSPFIFDDHAAIIENSSIRSPASLWAILNPPANGSGVTGRPIVNISLAINYMTGGLEVSGYHWTNILIHAGSALLLFGCIYGSLRSSTWVKRYVGHPSPIATWGSVIWAVHPLQTESVTCVVQRTELLVGFFYLACLFCFIKAAKNRSSLWAALAIGASYLGMASKEVMVSAPVMIFLYDRTFVAGSFLQAWRRRGRLHLGIASGWVLLAVLLWNMGGSRGEAAGFDVGAEWWQYAFTQAKAIVHYLWLSIWPYPLVLFYGTDLLINFSDIWPQFATSAALFLASAAAAWRGTPSGFLGIWFFAILSPSSSVVPLVSQTMAEHRMYLPLAAVVIGAVVALFNAVGRRGIWVAATASIALAVASARRNIDYRSELVIWTDTVAKVPSNARARINLGAALKSSGDRQAALVQYETAASLDPRSPEAFNNIATIYIETGKPADAIGPCHAALKLKPEFAQAHNNLGSALLATGNHAEGIAHLRHALSIQPNLPEAHANLASVLLAANDVEQAIHHAEQAARLKPDFALPYFTLGCAHLLRNNREDAVVALQQAIRRDPRLAAAHSNLGAIYYQVGSPAHAIPHFEAALRERPEFADARNNLASAYAQTGRLKEAIAEYRAVIERNPNFADAHLNLGLALARTGAVIDAIGALERAAHLRPGDPQIDSSLSFLRNSIPRP